MVKMLNRHNEKFLFRLYYYSIDQVMETGFPEEFLANGYFNDYETTTGGYPSPSPSYP